MLSADYPKCIVMSAVREADMEKLHKAIRTFFRKRLVKGELFLPWRAQQLRGELFASCEVLEERAEAEGAFFSVRGEKDAIEELRERIGKV